MRWIVLGCVIGLWARAAAAYDWERYRVEDFEEPAGSMSLIEINPADGIYGVGLGDGTWLKGTPVLGDYFLSLFWNDLEEALYGNVGMTLRLMPHGAFAPFAGGGGSYNQTLGAGADEELETDGGQRRGESYWGAHAEAGLRLRRGGRLIELLGRYTWSSSTVPRTDYWSVRLAVGIPAAF